MYTCQLCTAQSPNLRPWHSKACCPECVELGNQLEQSDPAQRRPLAVALHLLLEQRANDARTGKW